MKESIADLTDRLIIQNIIANIEGRLRDIDIEPFKIDEVGLGDLIDRLSIINIKISILEADIRYGREKELGLEEVGRKALIIRNLNKERVALKNAIKDYFKDGYKDIKVKHRSE